MRRTRNRTRRKLHQNQLNSTTPGRAPLPSPTIHDARITRRTTNKSVLARRTCARAFLTMRGRVGGHQPDVGFDRRGGDATAHLKTQHRPQPSRSPNPYSSSRTSCGPQSHALWTSNTSDSCSSADASIAGWMQKSCATSLMRTPAFPPRREPCLTERATSIARKVRLCRCLRSGRRRESVADLRTGEENERASMGRLLLFLPRASGRPQWVVDPVASGGHGESSLSASANEESLSPFGGTVIGFGGRMPRPAGASRGEPSWV